MTARPAPVWLFDLDNTLHDASHAAFGPTNQAMTDYIAQHLQLPHHEASALRQHYWVRYGATLLGLVRHHGIHAAHFLEETHRLPGLEDRLRTSAHDRAVLARLRGRKYILTNAPRRYALRVLDALRLTRYFDGVICIEDMAMFGHARPKPDARMLRHMAVRLKVLPTRCVLVEDTLQHQRAARSVGMRTVWMQRYLRPAVPCPEPAAGAGAALDVAPSENPPGMRCSNANLRTQVGTRLCQMPPYVCARIRKLKALYTL